jgi:hypothetical protein
MIRKWGLVLLIPLLFLAPALAGGNWTLYFDPFAVTNWDNTINNTRYQSSGSVMFAPGDNFLSQNVIIGFVIDAPDIPGSMQNFSVSIHHADGSIESGYWNISFMFYGIGANLINDVRIGTVNYQDGPGLAISTDSLATILAYSTFNNETGLISTISPWSVISSGTPVFGFGYPDYKANVFPTFTTGKYITEIDVSALYLQTYSVRILWLPKDQFANAPANLIVAPQNQPLTPTLPRITVAQINQVFGFMSTFLIFIVDMEVLIATNWLWFFVIAEVTIIMLAFFESGGRIFAVPAKWWRNQKKLFNFGLWGVEQLEKHYIFFIAVGVISTLGWLIQTPILENVSNGVSWFLKIFGI